MVVQLCTAVLKKSTHFLMVDSLAMMALLTSSLVLRATLRIITMGVGWGNCMAVPGISYLVLEPALS